jgi:hypothetical protein
MTAHPGIACAIAASLLSLPSIAPAQGASASAAMAAAQQEADWRVIAARCGTPAFERSFYRQSKAAVAAGLVARNRDPVELEKTITSLRRSPVVLVASTADCPEQLKQLAQLQKDRASALKGGHRAGAR